MMSSDAAGPSHSESEESGNINRIKVNLQTKVAIH